MWARRRRTDFSLLGMYLDYLPSSFSATTATRLSSLLVDEISHDQVSRMLNCKQLDAKDWWLMARPHVRCLVHGEDGVMTFDESILEKPYADENGIIPWHYYHTKGQIVMGINFITTLHEVDGIMLPVAFRLVAKTEKYTDEKGKP